MVFRYYPLVLVLIIVDDEHIEPPAFWYLSVDLDYPLDDVKLDPFEVEPQAKTESFGICFLQSPHPEKSFQPLRFWYYPFQQGMLKVCQLLLVIGMWSRKLRALRLLGLQRRRQRT